MPSRTPPLWQWAPAELTARGEGLVCLALLSEHTDWCARAFSAEYVPGTVGKVDESHLFFKKLFFVLPHLEKLEGSAEAQCVCNV